MSSKVKQCIDVVIIFRMATHTHVGGYRKYFGTRFADLSPATTTELKIKSGMYITFGPISMMRWVDDIYIYPFPYLSIHLVIYHTIEFVLIEIKLVFLRKLLHEASFCVRLVET